MKFEFKNNKLKLEFEINSENKIQLTYFGDSKNILLTPSTIVEADLTETNHSNNNYSKKCGSYFGTNSKYLSHKITDNELIIVTVDEFIEVESHFILYDGVAGLSTYNIVKNISKIPINLQYISSFYLIGMGQVGCENHEHMFVNYALNGWNSEAQWRRQSFLDVALFSPNHRVNMNRFELNNTGSWSTKQYLPMCGIENELTKFELEKILFDLKEFKEHFNKKAHFNFDLTSKNLVKQIQAFMESIATFSSKNIIKEENTSELRFELKEQFDTLFNSFEELKKYAFRSKNTMNLKNVEENNHLKEEIMKIF